MTRSNNHFQSDNS